MYSNTVSLIGATFFIALAHAVMPTHWMPFALIGREQKWSLPKTILITAIAGLGHSVTTSILGSIIALLGFEITKYVEAFSEPLSGSILIILGIAFIVVGRLKPHVHSHSNITFSDKAIFISLFMMLSFSPCVAMLPIFLAASTFSWSMLLLLCIILSATTVSVMLILTILAYSGVKRIVFSKIECYEKEIIGGILSVIGVIFLIVH